MISPIQTPVLKINVVLRTLPLNQYIILCAITTLIKSKTLTSSRILPTPLTELFTIRWPQLSQSLTARQLIALLKPPLISILPVTFLSSLMPFLCSTTIISSRRTGISSRRYTLNTFEILFKTSPHTLLRTGQSQP